jgi:hypothetical protein
MNNIMNNTVSLVKDFHRNYNQLVINYAYSSLLHS